MFQRLFITTLLFLGFRMICLASTPGFIITTKGDTIRGLISYTDILLTPVQIKFKAQGATEWEELTPAEIKYFELENKAHTAYRAYSGLVTMDRDDEFVMNNFRDTSVALKTIFLRTIERGQNVTLYQFVDTFKERYFLAANNIPPEELVFRRYYSYVPGSSFGHKTVIERAFRAQLIDAANYFNNVDEGFFWSIEHSEYARDSLRDIVKLINRAPKLKKKITKR